MTMSFSDRYIEFVKNKTIAEPEKNWNKILLGFQGNALINKLRPPKNLAKGYQKLNDLMLSFIAKALSSGSRYIWGNILAPCEVINSMGIRMISVEALACFLSGYHLEDFFIDYAQSIGLAPTLCSYHKAFVGAVESGVCPKPKYAVTTSLSCDGNLNTFRFLEKQEQVPFSLLDVPYTNDEDAVEYLADQIRKWPIRWKIIWALLFRKTSCGKRFGSRTRRWMRSRSFISLHKNIIIRDPLRCSCI